jgi:peptidoglycan hydrolase-like protein with peptidoglycan-binding domain
VSGDWRVAPALERLHGQLNAHAPQRSKASDGAIGDTAHAARTSDHNPWFCLAGQRYVTARDWTHDPRGGLDCAQLAAALRDGRDRRVKYVIWREQIMAGFSGPAPWTWRPYTGSNPHDKHLHLSVVADARALTNIDWILPGLSAVGSTPQRLTTVRPTVRRGDAGALVALMQRFLGLPEDGVFGEHTEAAVRRYQAMRGLGVDGVCGPRTWTEMGLAG